MQSYQESIEIIKSAIGWVVTLIGILVSVLAAAVGYVVVRHKGEYKEAVREAKEAGKEAGGYAEKVQEKLDTIDKMVERKLKEIEDKGKAQIEALIKVADKRREESRKEAERQRKISELWNEGLRAVKNEDYELATNKFKQIVEDFKMEDAAAYNNWGVACAHLARRKEGKERKTLMGEAKEKCLKAESIKRGAGAYNLACANCLLGDEEECKKWLKVGEEEKTLPTREHAMEDKDLESVRDKGWFKEIRWKGE